MSAAATKGKVAAEAAKIISEAINRVQVGPQISKEKLIAKLRKQVAVVAEERATTESGATFEYLTGNLTVPESTELAGVKITGGQVNLYKAIRNLVVSGAVVKCGLDKECLRQALHEALQQTTDGKSEPKPQKASD